MKKVIKVRLDPHSIDAAIREIEAYKRDLELRVRLLLKTLTDRGVHIAKAKVVEHEIIHDSFLTNTIHGFVWGDKGFIRVDDKYAVFFEFGTGPVGERNPHPLGGVSYKKEGWFTAANGKDMEGLYYWVPMTASDGNVIYYTEGQSAKPFMYETALKLREEFPAIIKEVFG